MDKVAYYEEIILEKIGATKWKGELEGKSSKEQQLIKDVSGWSSNKQTEGIFDYMRRMGQKYYIKYTDDPNVAYSLEEKINPIHDNAFGNFIRKLKIKSAINGGVKAYIEPDSGLPTVYLNPEAKRFKKELRKIDNPENLLAQKGAHETDEIVSLLKGDTKTLSCFGARWGSHASPGVVHNESARVSLAPESVKKHLTKFRKSLLHSSVEEDGKLKSQYNALQDAGVAYGSNGIIDKAAKKNHVKKYVAEASRAIGRNNLEYAKGVPPKVIHLPSKGIELSSDVVDIPKIK